jgi:hypothetical protein
MSEQTDALLPKAGLRSNRERFECILSVACELGVCVWEPTELC